MAQPANSAELAGSFPVFLLEIAWEGRTYRFSTYPVELAKADGESVGFDGGLADPNLEERLESMAADMESDGVQIEVVFPVDLVERLVVGGISLETARGELSMALERAGRILNTYETRIRLFSGTVLQPIIGDPGKPAGTAAFTLERNPLADPVPMIPSAHRITKRLFPDIPPYPNNNAIGKAWPIVIGSPGRNIPIPSGSAGIALSGVYATPAYLIYRDSSSGTSPYWPHRLMIAGHAVEAASVQVEDYAGNTATLAVQTAAADTYGGLASEAMIYSYVEFDFDADGLVTPSITGHETASPEYWVQWLAGGGMSNPLGSGELTYAGDVVRWALGLCRADVDLQAWLGRAAYLDSVAKFAGYINDPEVDAYTWLMDNILPYLPIEAVNGPDGIRPVAPVLSGGAYIMPSASVETGEGWYIVGPIVTESEPDDLLNRVEVRFGLGGSGDFLSSYTLTGEAPRSQLDYFNASDEIARISRSRHGDRFEVVEPKYIHDLSSAAAVARYLVRRNALTRRSLACVADTAWGWLRIGDVVAVTSAAYHFSGHRFQITAKSWAEGSWHFTLEIEENPALQGRP